MAWGTDGSPTRFGAGQSSPTDNLSLFLEIYGGEVITAFETKRLMADKHRTKNITEGKSARFPRTWKATAEYLTPGKEMLGNDIETGERIITVDGMLVAHNDLFDLDEAMSHFDARQEFVQQLGIALAETYDTNVSRSIVIGARESADGPFPAGNVVSDTSLGPISTNKYDGNAWVDAIIEANLKFSDKDVPEELTRFAAVNPRIFSAIRNARDANGHPMFLHADTNPASYGISGVRQVLDVEGVMVMPSRLVPNEDDSSDTTVYADYRANFENTVGIMWVAPAVCTLTLLDVFTEAMRDTRRLSNFNVAAMAVGHGVLRPEGCLEFSKAGS